MARINDVWSYTGTDRVEAEDLANDLLGGLLQHDVRYAGWRYGAAAGEVVLFADVRDADLARSVIDGNVSVGTPIPDPETFELRLGAIGNARVSVDVVEGGGALDTDLDTKMGYDPNDREDRGAIMAIEAVKGLILAHACAGIDITDTAYIEGLNTVLESLGNDA